MNINQIILILVFYVFICCETKPFKRIKNSPRPIILVPGTGGSQLYAKLDKPEVIHYICDKKTNNYFNLWLNLELIVPFVIDCWIDNVRLIYDEKTRTTSNPPGVDIQTIEFGNTTSIEYIDPSKIKSTGYFNLMVEKLIQVGYQESINLRGAPYDFRKSPTELQVYYKQLKSLIKETFLINNNRSSILVCHSMGCMLMLHFLNQLSQDWKDKYVYNLVTLGAPWGGSVKAVKAFVSGDDLGVYVIPTLSIRKIERTFPSVAFLLPSRDFWPNNEKFMRRIYDNQTVSEYGVENYKEIFDDIDLTPGYEMWKDTKDLVNGLNPPNVEIHCLHGYAMDTIDFLEYSKGFPDSTPKMTYGDGDGTVNARSLQGCLRWKGKQSKEVYYKKFYKIEHMGTMSSPDVIDYVVNLGLNSNKNFNSKKNNY